jgi:serine protease Do
MAAASTGFILGALAGASVAAAAMVGVGFQPASALADAAPGQAAPVGPSPARAGLGPTGTPMSFADIVARVAPAVVSINVTSTVDRQGLGLPEELQPRRGAPQGKGGKGDQGDDDQGDDGQGDAAPGGGDTAMASGSGFFISPDGYIVTNNHVVENAKDIKVVLPGPDQRELPAKIVGRDEGTDLAVLKVDGSKYPYVDFENSARPRVGDWVIAVGNPFGLGGSATAGIISAYGRDIGEKFVDYIQIDAPINRGNSGGPTFDVYGRVIGVNTAIFSPSGGSVGIGFAIPADVADSITKQLIAQGKITRGYLGATIQDVSPEIADSFGKPDMKGALVDELAPGGPAAKAGVQPGDVVLSINGSAVTGATDLTRHVAGSRSGDVLRLGLLRGGQTLTLAVRSGTRPSEDELLKAENGGGDDQQGGSETAPAAKPGALGLSLTPLDAAARRRFGIPADVRGAVVADVDSDSDAADKGVKQGDVILRVNQKAVAGPADVAVEVAAAKKAGRSNVLLFVYHDHHQAAVPVRIVPESGGGDARG